MSRNRRTQQPSLLAQTIQAGVVSIDDRDPWRQRVAAQQRKEQRRATLQAQQLQQQQQQSGGRSGGVSTSGRTSGGGGGGGGPSTRHTESYGSSTAPRGAARPSGRGAGELNTARERQLAAIRGDDIYSATTNTTGSAGATGGRANASNLHGTTRRGEKVARVDAIDAALQALPYELEFLEDEAMLNDVYTILYDGQPPPTATEIIAEATPRNLSATKKTLRFKRENQVHGRLAQGKTARSIASVPAMEGDKLPQLGDSSRGAPGSRGGGGGGASGGGGGELQGRPPALRPRKSEGDVLSALADADVGPSAATAVTALSSRRAVTAGGDRSPSPGRSSVSPARTATSASVSPYSVSSYQAFPPSSPPSFSPLPPLEAGASLPANAPIKFDAAAAAAASSQAGRSTSFNRRRKSSSSVAGRKQKSSSSAAVTGLSASLGRRGRSIGSSSMASQSEAAIPRTATTAGGTRRASGSSRTRRASSLASDGAVATVSVSPTATTTTSDEKGGGFGGRKISGGLDKFESRSALSPSSGGRGSVTDSPKFGMLPQRSVATPTSPLRALLGAEPDTAAFDGTDGSDDGETGGEGVSATEHGEGGGGESGGADRGGDGGDMAGGEGEGEGEGSGGEGGGDSSRNDEDDEFAAFMKTSLDVMDDFQSFLRKVGDDKLGEADINFFAPSLAAVHGLSTSKQHVVTHLERKEIPVEMVQRGVLAEHSALDRLRAHVEAGDHHSARGPARAIPSHPLPRRRTKLPPPPLSSFGNEQKRNRSVHYGAWYIPVKAWTVQTEANMTNTNLIPPKDLKEHEERIAREHVRKELEHRVWSLESTVKFVDWLLEKEAENPVDNTVPQSIKVGLKSKRRRAQLAEARMRSQRKA